jgi:hypothetical protein
MGVAMHMQAAVARHFRVILISAVIVVLALVLGCNRHASSQFTVTVPVGVRPEPLTGRIFVIISHQADPEPRFALAGNGYLHGMPPLFGIDVSALPAAKAVEVGGMATGYPLKSVQDIPAGDYYVQALANVYTEFHRSDGHVIWAHMDQWEGQHAADSPGNLVSEVKKVHLDPGAGFDVKLELTRVLPPVTMPADDQWVKRVKFQSDLLTKFWGRPIYLGATVLLPKDYDKHPNVYYPVLYEQTHFNQQPGNVPLGFSTKERSLSPAYRAALARYKLQFGYEIYKAWNGPNFPRMIAVTFQHPTPFYDDSYAVNSVNVGPYGDAIMQELIPYVESHFRIIRKPYARVLTGGSTGGWEALALQLYHPDFFGGTWPFCPDPIDFRHYGLVNIYDDDDAFVSVQDADWQSPVGEWLHPERYFNRGTQGQPFITIRQQSQMEAAMGSHGHSGDVLDNWVAVYGPVGDDGYPKPLWDKGTGKIDHSVSTYMRDHGYDLRAYLEKNWSTLAPKLVDKIHIDVGDMDNYYLNLAVYDFQELFDLSQHPHVAADFRYGRPKMGHGWVHALTTDILREMAGKITAHAPRGENSNSWKY